MQWFKFNWLTSNERQELERLRAERSQIDRSLGNIEKKSEELDTIIKELTNQEKPYKSLRVIGNNTVICILHDGIPLSGDISLLEKARTAKTEEELIQVFTAPTDRSESVDTSLAETQEQRELVTRNLRVLKDHPDFKITEDNKVFFKDVNLELPASVISSFIEIVEKIEHYDNDVYRDLYMEIKEQYDALTMFWYWTALNPIASSRNDLLNFVRSNQISITSNGLLEMYRRVVSRGKPNKEMINLISGQYFKIKQKKQDPANYVVVDVTTTITTIVEVDNGYYEDGDWDDELEEYLGNEWVENMEEEEKTEVTHSFLLKEWPYYPTENERILGTLQQLYLDLPTLSENIYTDAHTRSKEIRVGSIYREDEDKIDLSNERACSAGLHVGSSSFMFDGFGDTGVMALVNPSKVRSVPVFECNKMRVAEMYVCAIVDIEDYKAHVEDADVADYSKEYFNTSLEALEGQVKEDRNTECQGNVVEVNDIERITRLIKDRIVHLS